VQVFVGSQNPSADSFDEIEKFKIYLSKYIKILGLASKLLEMQTRGQS